MDKIVEQTTYNVIADIPGTLDCEDYIIVGAHYEGHDIAQGAVDSGSGASVIMEMSRALMKIRDHIKRRIRFVCFGAEEIGCYGSVNYVKQHLDELKNLRLMLNLDAAGNIGRKGIGLNGVTELEDFFNDAVNEMQVDAPIYQRVTPYSDHFPFFVKGVPTASGGDPEARLRIGGRGYGHTKFDTLDKVDLRYLRESASNYSRFILRISNANEWPVQHRKRSETEEMLRNLGFLDTIQLNQEVKNFIKNWEYLSPHTIAWIEGKIAQAADFWHA